MTLPGIVQNSTPEKYAINRDPTTGQGVDNVLRGAWLRAAG